MQHLYIVYSVPFRVKMPGHGVLDRFGSERDADSTWLVLDYVDSIVHLFEPTARAHYDLEMLWGDAPKIDWRKDSGGEEQAE